MFLKRADPLRGELGGGWVGPGKRDFLGPEMQTSEASVIWAPKNKKSNKNKNKNLYLKV